MTGIQTKLLRELAPGEEARVDFSELFFDLIFVFSVTQISHALLEHLDWPGLLQALMLLMMIWTVWINTAWGTNWLNPKQPAVRMFLFAQMLVGLLLACAIPRGFGESGPMLALAYVAMHLGRTIFGILASRHHDRAVYRNYLRMLVWFSTSGAFWIAGGFLHDEQRLVFWVVALGIEYTTAIARLWTPGLGATPTEEAHISGDHLAERCGLFVILSLGEVILLIGTTFADLIWTPPAVAAFVASFLTLAAMWWIYFAHGAEIARHRIAQSDNPAALGRYVYSYVHILIVAGIVLTAVGSELVLAHPVAHHADFWTAFAVLCGPALVLLGNMMFKWLVSGRLPIMRLAGVFVLGAAMPVAGALQPLALSALSVAVLLAVAILEWLAGRVEARRMVCSAKSLRSAQLLHAGISQG